MQSLFKKFGTLVIVVLLSVSNLHSQSTKKLYGMAALDKNNTKLLQYLEQGGDPNVKVVFQSMLNIACYSNAHENIRTLLEHRANVNGIHSVKPIHRAAETYLLYRNNTKWTVSDQDFIKMIKILYEYKADVNDLGDIVKYEYSNSAPKYRNFLYEILYKAPDTAIKILIDCGLNQFNNLLSAHDGRFDVIDILIKTEKWDVVEYLIDKKDKNVFRYLGQVIYYNKVDLAKKMICAGDYVDSLNHMMPTLAYAVIANNMELIDLLLDKGASVNMKGEGGQTALHFAVKKGNIDALKKFIDKGGDIDIKTDNGYSPIFFAVEISSSLDVLKYLHKEGSDLFAKTSDGSTLLHVAILKGSNFEIVDYLIKNGVDIDAKNKNGETAFHLACAFGMPDAIDMLIIHSPNVNALTNAKRIPLHYLCTGSKRATPSIDEVKILIERGANINARDENNRTARKLASMNRHKQVANYLKKIGAEK